MGSLQLIVRGTRNYDFYIDNISLIKTSDISGERSDRIIPNKAQFTIINIGIS